MARLQDAQTPQRAVSYVRKHAATSGWQEGNDALLAPGVRQSLPPVQHHPLRDDSGYPVIRYVRALKNPTHAEVHGGAVLAATVTLPITSNRRRGRYWSWICVSRSFFLNRDKHPM